jgi:hypothetical protein
MPLHTTHCSPLPPIPAHLHWQPFIPCAGSEPAPRWIKNSPRKRTRMTQIKRIFTDFPNRANPRHPCNPCSTSASLFVDAPEIRNAMYLQFAQTTNLRSSAFICGSYFAEAPDINCSIFIKVWASQNSSPQRHHIQPNSSSKQGTLLSERRLNAARKTKYAFLQLFNSKIDKTGDNENI